MFSPEYLNDADEKKKKKRQNKYKLKSENCVLNFENFYFLSIGKMPERKTKNKNNKCSNIFFKRQ